MFELQRMPPLGTFHPRGGFVPDYPLFLMFDEFVMGGDAYERIKAKSDASWLGEWPKVVEILSAEGALSLIDMEEEVRRLGGVRGAMLRRDLREPGHWAGALGYHEALMGAAHRAFTSNPQKSKPLKWEYKIGDTLGHTGTDGQSHLLSAVLRMEPNETDEVHEQLESLARDEVRFQLREVNAGLALSSHFSLAPMFWAPYKGYLEGKGEQAIDAMTVSEGAEASRLFFQIAFPTYRPKSIEEVLHLRKNRRLKALRREILSVAASGDLSDIKYPQRILEEVLAIERRVGRFRQISGWISQAIGLVPIPGASQVASAVAEGATFMAARRLRKKMSWFYLISNGRGNT